MNTKEFIQLFIPPIYYKIKHRLCPPKERVRHPLPMFKGACERMIVIGNGPSLNKSVELYGDILKSSACLMVNHSASTDMYEFIRPKFYLLVDPAWKNPDIHPHKEAVYHTIEAIVSKTTWPMTIIMPRSAMNGYAVREFQSNANLSVMFFEEGWAIPAGISQIEAWNNNLVSPPGQTVLNSAIWLAIYWGIKETYIVGADTTWMENSRMDQTNNKLYEYDTHFYASQDVYGDMKSRQKNDFRYLNISYSQSLMEMYNVIHGYEELEEYAKWKGVKVYNASEYSWIDAFERKKLDTIA